MSEQEQLITVPDIGTDDQVEVIEINVKVGDIVAVEDTLITLESEKASMEIPSNINGIVASLLVKVGDKVTTGSKILAIKTAERAVAEPENSVSLSPKKYEQYEQAESSEREAQKSQEPIKSIANNINNTQSDIIPADIIPVKIPDIGTDNKVEIIEIQVKPGDSVAKEDSLITLESEKASMDIPAPQAGIIQDILVKVGDKVTVGDLILHLATTTTSIATTATTVAQQESDTQSSQVSSKKDKESKTTPYTVAPSIVSGSVATDNKHVYASPSVRRFANDLGVNLTRVIGTGRKNRILKLDIEHYVKAELAKTQSGNVQSQNNSGLNLGNLGLASLPEIDFSKFGQVTEQPLKRIQKISAANLHRNWVMIPHVTQFDEADISDMESFRQKYKKQAEVKGYKLTPLVFLMRAAAQALKLMPQFNVSLANDGVNIIQKHYYHIGIAVDTPNGLVVPVIRDVDQKGLFQLAAELADVSQKARDGKLQAKDMQGGCFSISSLGGIGGTAFTPIINAPEVAILGVSKSQMKPVYINGEFVPRLMLPLSLSYDHRAIDGAAAAKFITLYSQLLGDISQLLL
jgi:pyruvate dehydrogenase E2 component (dihydrolipoamide acetyltransferase)